MKKESKYADSLISEEGSIPHYMKMKKKSKQVFGTAKPGLKKNKSAGRKTPPKIDKKSLLKLTANLTSFRLESKLSSNGIQKKMKKNHSGNDKDDKDNFRGIKLNDNKLLKKLNENKFLKKFYPNEKIYINNERPLSMSPSRPSIRPNI